MAFFSSGHFKKLQDFDPRHRDDDGEGRRDPFVGIDLEMLQQVLVLDRVPWIEKTGRSSLLNDGELFTALLESFERS